MNVVTLDLPESIQQYTELFVFCRDLDDIARVHDVVIQMHEGITYTPFSFLYLGLTIRRLSARYKKTKIIFSNMGNADYPNRARFFSLCDPIESTNPPNRWGTSKFIPITRLTRAALNEQDRDWMLDPQELVERRASQAASVLLRDAAVGDDSHAILSYSIRELIRNSFEHAQTDEVFVMAQHFSKSGTTEFAVADCGCGVRQALGENPNFRARNDLEALTLALKPSVSGKTGRGDERNFFSNSGYGLYMTRRIATLDGNFVIASGTSAIYQNSARIIDMQCDFSGTITKISLPSYAGARLENYLDQFRKEGQSEAKSIPGTSNRPPSGMSLRRPKSYE